MLKNTIKKLPKKLPKFLHKYFWETKVNQINPQRDSFYLINRLLDRGNLESFKWVFDNYSEDLIKTTIKKTRDWQQRSIYFWSSYFNLPNNKVKCLNRQYLNQRKTFWPY